MSVIYIKQQRLGTNIGHVAETCSYTVDDYKIEVIRLGPSYDCRS